MKNLSIYLSIYLLAVLCSISANAQIVKGDMNDDKSIDVSDLNETINIMLGLSPYQYILAGGGDPYLVDNSRVVGTWYQTKSSHFTLNADGTTDYSGAATYKFLPYQGALIFYDNNGTPVTQITVDVLKDGYMVCVPLGTGVLTVLTTTPPTQLVTSIMFIPDNIELGLGQEMELNTLVLPSTADNKIVVYKSSDESVVRMKRGGIAVAEGMGTANIICRATDGSGVSDTCTVTVTAMDSHGNKYVDLGLPSGTLWAAWNVGANAPSEYGLYFAWGETTGYTKDDDSRTFNYKSYKWMKNGRESKEYMIKYTKPDGEDGTEWYVNHVYAGTTVDGVTYKSLIKLLPEDDAATANWGSEWRMPSPNEIRELYNEEYTTTEWVTENGVNGCKITSKSNGNSIFLPAAGYFPYQESMNGLQAEGSFGCFWTNSLGLFSYWATYLGFNDGMIKDYNNGGRQWGLPVRAVRVNY